MSENLTLIIDGRPLTVTAGTTVAAALLMAGASSRRSVSGQPRTPVCGMGVCMECRATVNGAPQQRTCQILCTEAMEVITG
ncbi:(2Fe-2S)-binding protein [Telmatobacter bradus]|uniref:(2Fe-2S)-binding protein n=1 Tax=Telmatobacter bradus TaxID=474953 RepID=UPI003B42E90C